MKKWHEVGKEKKRARLFTILLISAIALLAVCLTLGIILSNFVEGANGIVIMVLEILCAGLIALLIVSAIKLRDAKTNLKAFCTECGCKFHQVDVEVVRDIPNRSGDKRILTIRFQFTCPRCGAHNEFFHKFTVYPGEDPNIKIGMWAEEHLDATNK